MKSIEIEKNVIFNKFESVLMMEYLIFICNIEYNTNSAKFYDCAYTKYTELNLNNFQMYLTLYLVLYR